MEAIEVAASVWACVPARPSDRQSVALLAHCLFDDAAVHGHVDVSRALMPDNTARWLGQRAEYETIGSVRRDRSILRAAGRVVHPGSTRRREAATAKYQYRCGRSQRLPTRRFAGSTR